jgi:hypothetical protein
MLNKKNKVEVSLEQSFDIGMRLGMTNEFEA